MYEAKRTFLPFFSAHLYLHFFKRLSLVLLLQVEKPKFAPEMCLEDETVLKSIIFLQIDPAVCDIVAP